MGWGEPTQTGHGERTPRRDWTLGDSLCDRDVTERESRTYPQPRHQTLNNGDVRLALCPPPPLPPDLQFLQLLEMEVWAANPLKHLCLG